ncbi:MAG: bifunctional 2-polyprenyl-6-hydroxyphenol methylase/3-demethylubiquinol 3-O-methyltransferase UbiG [Pseudomonadota bacterium]
MTTKLQPDSTVDDYEVAHYSKLAETWWDMEGPFWPLHTLNALRATYIRDQLCARLHLDATVSEPLSGVAVLDVGCGGGILSESMARMGASVTGIDIVEKNIGIASQHARDSGLTIDYQQRTVASLADTGAQFDVVLNMEVVEHVADLNAFMRDCGRLVRSGGSQFVATINRNPLAWFVAIFGAEYVLRWLPRGTHRYRMLRKPSEVRACLERDGFDLASFTGVRVNPLSRTMTLTPMTAINYMLLAHKR